MAVSSSCTLHHLPFSFPRARRAYNPHRPISLVSSPCSGCKTHAGASSQPRPAPIIQAPADISGGTKVAELVGAFNDLTERMGEISTTSSSQLLFKSLKVAIPLLRSLPCSSDGRSPLSRALSVAYLLADLQMDAEVISAGLLWEAAESGLLTMHDLKSQISTSTAHLLHEYRRIKNAPRTVDFLDDENAMAIRKFFLTYYDVRAIILELAVKLDAMRHIDCLPRCHKQSLEVMKIYAPLAHAVGACTLSLELEDIAFQSLFPYSYLYLDAWLRRNEKEHKSIINGCKDRLLHLLNHDGELVQLVDEISIKGRCKSRFSTMKKLLRGGRSPQEVHDLLGLRVVLNPKPGTKTMEGGLRACYRAYELVRGVWGEVEERTKDYIFKPKENGYRSLHVVVDLGGDGKIGMPFLEIQIRTKEMDTLADAGAASHSLYKGGLTDPREVKRLKAIMLAAAEHAALRLRDLPPPNHGGFDVSQSRAFRLLDKNGDGRISIEELTEVMEDLGAGGKDAQELMKILDANNDGSLSSHEFDLFQRQIEVARSLEDRDDHFRAVLGEKLRMADDGTGLIQVYRKELGDKLAVNLNLHHSD